MPSLMVLLACDVGGRCRGSRSSRPPGLVEAWHAALLLPCGQAAPVVGTSRIPMPHFAGNVTPGATVAVPGREASEKPSVVGKLRSI